LRFSFAYDISFHFNLIPAVGADAGAQDIEMQRLEVGEGFIDQVIKPRRLNAFALKRLRYPRRIRLRDLGLMIILTVYTFAIVNRLTNRLTKIF
jgi:hypothetical protein